MPNKSKKDKESPKSGKSGKTGGKDAQENSEHEGSNKKKNGPSAPPPTTPLLKGKQAGSQTHVKKDKRASSSPRFSISNNTELQKLSAFKEGLSQCGEQFVVVYSVMSAARRGPVFELETPTVAGQSSVGLRALDSGSLGHGFERQLRHWL
ncbi:hypothetical protein AAFF_G00048110 [Aldrovandia affinis]|uniref:Uncharacterized protein n=1 Tax=Aldrovandia affinis TaxID=143900 RepID=A0AAD7WEV7_9TELE|nr:hypothetical protein AAFF_G00048110 [Aldrovandia affinis]